MKKKLGVFLAVLCIGLGLWQPGDTVFAANGATSVSVSSGSVNIGDTVTVTVKASGPSGEKANATMTLSYDSGVLQFVSCNTTYGGGGNSVIATGEGYTVTLKAIAAGSSSLSVAGNDGVIFDTNEEIAAMSASSASVTVNNAAGTGGTAGGGTGTGGTAGGGTGTGGAAGGGTGTGGTGQAAAGTQSGDNSLKSLTISPGTLSPAFTGKTTNYSATVGSDVTSIAVSATPVNANAVVESVTGNDSLKAGSNTVKIVVKAENGVTATYTINVTRGGGSAAETPPKDSEAQTETESNKTEVSADAITVNGVAYQITGDFGDEDIPADFTETTVSYHGSDYKGVSFDKGSMKLLWMEPADSGNASGSFFVYDETRDTLYPFVKLTSGERYVIALLAPVDFTMPESYMQTELMVDTEHNITAYQEASDEESEIVSDFYAFYAVNSDGTEGWYRYDALEGTFQRSSMTLSEEGAQTSVDMEALQEEYTKLSAKYTEEKAFSRNVIGVLVFMLAVFAIIIINLLLHRFRKKDDDHFGDDDFGGDDFDDDGSGADAKEDADTFAEEDMDDARNLGSRKKRFGKRRPLEDARGDMTEDSLEEAPEEPAEPEEKKKKESIEIIDFNDL